MKTFILIITASFLAAASVLASDYNFVSPEKVKIWIETQAPVTIVDIQVKEEFESHHLPGSIATYAYPVKSDVEKARLDDAVAVSIAKGNPVVVVCPRGGGGAKNCYDYMKSKNVPEDKLLILTDGMAGWPYKDLLESGK
ncbi:MAG: rhodanese-like domain-containing protein [Pseudomonadota bacterium]